jgi:hypothetical protein
VAVVVAPVLWVEPPQPVELPVPVALVLRQLGRPVPQCSTRPAVAVVLQPVAPLVVEDLPVLVVPVAAPPRTVHQVPPTVRAAVVPVV